MLDKMLTSWKTTSAGLAMIIMNLGPFIQACKNGWVSGDWKGLEMPMTLLLGGIGFLFARDHSVTSEQAGLKPDNKLGENITKIVASAVMASAVRMAMTLLVGFFIMAALTGCASTGGINVATTAAVAKIAAKDATYFALKQHPEWRPQFDVALADLTVLANATNISVAQIAAIVERLPIKELKGDTAQLIISDVQIVVEEIVPNTGQILSADKFADPRVVVTAIRDGVALGIAQATPQASINPSNMDHWRLDLGHLSGPGIVLTDAARSSVGCDFGTIKTAGGDGIAVDLVYREWPLLKITPAVFDEFSIIGTDATAASASKDDLRRATED